MCCQPSADPLQYSDPKSTFEYGGAYKRLSDSIHFIARDTAAEVCEGDSFLLQCAPNTSILLGPDTDIRFGRNGVWEPGEVVTILGLLSSHWTYPIGQIYWHV